MHVLKKLGVASFLLCFLPHGASALPVEHKALSATDFEASSDGQLCAASDWAISDNGDPKRMLAAMAYARRARCEEARAALVSRFLQSESNEVYEAAYDGLSELIDAMVLTQILAQVERLEDGKALLALRLLSRICDQSCTPYVAAMLRHVSPEVAEAAAKTARILGDPKLAPALQEVVKSRATPSLRLAAMAAWADIASEDDYLGLLSMLNVDKIDELSLRIVRALPSGLRKSQAPYFASLAEHRALVTSVASAYLEAPDALIDALLERLQRPLKSSARSQVLRTLVLVLPSLNRISADGLDVEKTADDGLNGPIDAQNRAASISKKLEAIVQMWPPSVDDLVYYAALFASLDLDGALIWILGRADELKSSDWIEILSRVGPKNATQLLDLVEVERDQKPDNLSFLASLVDERGALGRAFAGLLSKSSQKSWPNLAKRLSQSGDVEIACRGTEALGRAADKGSCGVLEALLDSPNRELALAAMSAMSNCSESMPMLVERIAKAPSNDSWDAIYLARFALWAYVSGLDKTAQAALPWLSQAAAEAYRCAEMPQRRHAEAALLLLATLNLAPPELSAQEFSALSSDNKRAYMRALSKSGSKNATEVFLTAAKDTDAIVAAEAFGHLGRSDIDRESEQLDAMLRQAIDSSQAVLSLSAMKTAAELKLIGLQNAIEKRLYDADERVVYAALWALQKLDNLSNAETLRSLYYRMRSPILRKRLAFLSGLDPRFEKLAAAELTTGQRLIDSKRARLLGPGGKTQQRELTLFLDDQSLLITGPNAVGIVLYGE